MKYKYQNMSKIEQWMICQINNKTLTEVLSNANGEGLDIVFTINGVEVDFSQVVKGINASYDVAVSEEVLCSCFKYGNATVRNSIRDIIDRENSIDFAPK